MGGLRDAASRGAMDDPFATTAMSMFIENAVLPADLDKVKDLRRSLFEMQSVYSYCAEHYAKRYYALIAPLLGIATTIALLGAVWPFRDEEPVPTVGRVILAILGAISTMLTSMLALLKFQTKMDAFNRAATQIDGLTHKLSFATKYRRQRAKISACDVRRIIGQVEEMLSEVRAKVPPISMELWIAGCKKNQALEKLRRGRTAAARPANSKQAWEAGRPADGAMSPDTERPDSRGSSIFSGRLESKGQAEVQEMDC